jgi:hypothetical protein
MERAALGSMAQGLGIISGRCFLAAAGRVDNVEGLGLCDIPSLRDTAIEETAGTDAERAWTVPVGLSQQSAPLIRNWSLAYPERPALARPRRCKRLSRTPPVLA